MGYMPVNVLTRRPQRRRSHAVVPAQWYLCEYRGRNYDPTITHQLVFFSDKKKSEFDITENMLDDMARVSFEALSLERQMELLRRFSATVAVKQRNAAK